MKDLNLARMNTIVATGSLFISATGCKKKDKDDDDGKVPEKEEALQSLCEALPGRILATITLCMRTAWERSC
jgi:hypothetical protein